jgi:hypothetical protein
MLTWQSRPLKLDQLSKDRQLKLDQQRQPFRASGRRSGSHRLSWWVCQQSGVTVLLDTDSEVPSYTDTRWRITDAYGKRGHLLSSARPVLALAGVPAGDASQPKLTTDWASRDLAEGHRTLAKVKREMMKGATLCTVTLAAVTSECAESYRAILP